MEKIKLVDLKNLLVKLLCLKYFWKLKRVSKNT